MKRLRSYATPRGSSPFAAGASEQKQDGAGEPQFDRGNLGEWIRGARFARSQCRRCGVGSCRHPQRGPRRTTGTRLGWRFGRPRTARKLEGQAFAAWSSKSPRTIRRRRASAGAGTMRPRRQRGSGLGRLSIGPAIIRQPGHMPVPTGRRAGPSRRLTTRARRAGR